MSNFQSRNCYPGSNVLINKFEQKDQDKLDLLEVGFTAKRLMDLQKKPLKGNFDLNHLQALHKYIFQDVYKFAGTSRTENIYKDSFRFADARFIESSAEDLFKRLQNENHLTGLTKKEFSERAAFYMAEINVLHPFREGNGRTQREFIRTLAVRNGFELDWSRENKDQVLHASIRSKEDFTDLAKVIDNSITNEEPIIAMKKSFIRTTERQFDR